MKKFISLFICGCLFTLPVLAFENETEEEEKSSVNIDGSSYSFIFGWNKRKQDKARESHWAGAGFAFSKLGNLPDAAGLKLDRSYSVIMNLMEYNIPLDAHWLMNSGLGFDFSRYHFKGNTALRTIDGITQFTPDLENREYRDSKFIIYYASIPLMLEYQTKVNHRSTFFINGGVEGLIKLYSKSQAKIKTPDGIHKTTFKNLNLLPLNYRFTMRAGFNDVSVFGYYQPTSMFEKGKGPDVNTFGLGIMLNF